MGIPFKDVKIGGIFEPDKEGLGEIIVKNKNCMNGYFKVSGNYDPISLINGFIQAMRVI